MKNTYSWLSSDHTFTYNTCHHAKQRKLSFSLSQSHATKPFKLLHMDIWGPCSTTSLLGHKYFLTIVDDYTYYVWILLMQSKFETRSHIIHFINQMEK